MTRVGWLSWGLTGLLILTGNASLHAQITTGGGAPGGGGLGGGLGGGSLGGGSLGGGTALGGGSSLGRGLGSSTGLGGTGLGSGAGFTGGAAALGGGTMLGGANAFGGNSPIGASNFGSNTSLGASHGVAPSNPFGAYYANPFAAGLTGRATRAVFGSPLYQITTTTTSNLGLGGLSPGTGAIRSGGLGTGLGASSNSTTRRSPSYSATVAFPHRAAVPSRIVTDLQAMLTRSSALSNSPNIKVSVDGNTVVLQGQAADEHDRRLAEGMVRLTPGVHDVRNELQVRETLPPPEKAE